MPCLTFARRLFVQSLISENKIYDLETAGWGIDWGEESGFVYAGMILIGPNVSDCIGDRSSHVTNQK
ncbi:hypothetical protein DND90_11930 [Pseudomonas syringae pv. maculicola]|nr:hypothetical protein DND90_11930 [Pseudomonas syringae pv. maculicola]